MARIGIIGAMNSEVKGFCEAFDAAETACKGIFEGSAFGHTVYISESGIGKVNAAIAAQRLIDRFEVEYLINSGVAGCLTKELSTCDAVIAKELVYHDFTPLELLEHGSPYTSRFRADETLVRIALDACKKTQRGGGDLPLRRRQRRFGRLLRERRRKSGTSSQDLRRTLHRNGRRGDRACFDRERRPVRRHPHGVGLCRRERRGILRRARNNRGEARDRHRVRNAPVHPSVKSK